MKRIIPQELKVLYDYIRSIPKIPVHIITDTDEVFSFSLENTEYQVKKQNGLYLVDKADFKDYCWDVCSLFHFSKGRINVYNSVNFNDISRQLFFLDVNPVAGRRLDLSKVCETEGKEFDYVAFNGFGSYDGRTVSQTHVSACSLEHALFKINEEAKRENNPNWSIYRLTKPGELGIFAQKAN